MSKVWDEAAIQEYIDNKVQESLNLDYKAADSLAKSDGKKKDITKDVSSFANSAGGIIMYGVKEYNTPSEPPLPEKIDPIDQVQFPKEWLEQVINSIQPRIDGVIIYPVPLSSGANQVVYVVEIPQSTTAHQATDHRYYKRFNFQSVSMADYEIRDVMGRRQHPRIELHFCAIRNDLLGRSSGSNYRLEVIAKNSGLVYATYISGFVSIPTRILTDLEIHSKGKYTFEENEEKYCKYRIGNIVGQIDHLGDIPSELHLETELLSFSLSSLVYHYILQLFKLTSCSQ